ncbi:MAG: class I SAM-dependent methyltransferase, partial [Paracoccaceae bacterium]
GLEIARRVAGIVHAEFREMLPVLESLAPRRVADIGCGYALFDLFMARHFGTEHLLIDIETNDRRNFGYEKEAAAYTDMDVARQLMEANGVAAERVKTVNPERADPLAVGPVDLAVSFKSCGFHYPISTYMPFFESAVTPGGAVIVDLRARTADAQALELAALGVIEALTPPETKARRVLMRKAGD